MKKIAILFSGHLRNIYEIIHNLKNNLLDIISLEYDYDIYIHTWDNNITNDKILNNDKNYNKKIIDIKLLFKKNNINIKKILIENQEEIYDKLKINDYLVNNCINKSIHDNFDFEYVKDLTNKLFWQFYGHNKVFELVDNVDEYYSIIKTRPDLYYDKFDLSLLDKEIFFPCTHQYDNSNINQIFFGGKPKEMKLILKYFSEIIYKNNNINFEIINKYHDTNINFNQIFRYYIIDYLRLIPFFCNYNPKIYRRKNKFFSII